MLKKGEVGNDVESRDKDGADSADENDTSKSKDVQASSQVEMMSRADEKARLASKQSKPKPQYVTSLDDKKCPGRCISYTETS